MSEYQTALSIIAFEMRETGNILEALDLAAQVILDDRAVAAESTRVNLRKPVSLTKRADRPSNRTTPSVYPPKKYVGKHAHPYNRGSERITRAKCTRGGGVDLWSCSPEFYCPKHRPGTYTDAMARHATDSFPISR